MLISSFLLNISEKGSDDTEKLEKTQYRFLQKYYHKGAFFLDNDNPLLQRDYNIAVGEDLFDKSVLPSVLKKRRGNFGKKGQSKYTHLTDQVNNFFFNNCDKIFKRILLILIPHGNPMNL